MSFQQFIWDSPSLDEFRRKAQAGNLLFEQGSPAQSLFILIQGAVELIAKKNGVYAPVHYLGPGNLLGEQLLVERQLGPRSFGARALTSLNYLELNRQDIHLIQKNNLPLFNELLMVALRVSNLRINRMNRLLLNMRSVNLTERFLNLLLYFSVHHGQVTEEGKLVILNFDTVSFYIGINSVQFESLIEDLVSHGVLQRKKEGIYLIKNEKALFDQVPKIAQEIGTLDFV